MKKSILLAITLALSTPAFANSDQAILAFKNKNYTEAKSLFESQANSSQKHYYLGRIALAEKDLDKAQDQLERAVELEKENDNYHYWLGMVCLRQAANASIFTAPGYSSDARDHLEKSLALNPENLETMKGLVTFYLNVPAIVGGSTDKALEIANKMESVSKVDSFISKITIFREKDDKHLEIELAKKLASEFSNSPRALVKAGFTFQLQENYSEAFALFGKAASLTSEKNDSSPLSALYQIGRTSVLSKERTQEGIDALESYLTKEVSEDLPSKNWARYRLASLYQSINQIDKAIALAKVASEEEEDKTLRRSVNKLLKSLKKKRA